MHIHALTKKQPVRATTSSTVLVIFEIISAALGILSQLNSFVISVSGKNQT